MEAPKTIQQQIIEVMQDNGKPLSPVALLAELPESITQKQLFRALMGLQQKGVIVRIKQQGSADMLARSIAAWALVANA